MVKKLVALLAVLVLAYAIRGRDTATTAPPSDAPARTGVPASRVPSGEISGSGTVIRILPDDDEGDRHQRFILRLPSGQTLLVAHNIDVAPRVSPLDEGDIVEYKGEYVPNDKGGGVHWTHHDPAGNHPSGWLKHAGRTFQ